MWEEEKKGKNKVDEVVKWMWRNFPCPVCVLGWVCVCEILTIARVKLELKKKIKTQIVRLWFNRWHL